jgi:two-component system sensor histidine kinase PilS (NtrC family)
MRDVGHDGAGTLVRADQSVPGPLGILQWIYLGRVLVALALFFSAAFYFQAVSPGVLLTLALATLATFVASGGSAFYTHVLQRRPGPTFIYAQALFDLGLVTAVVHVTGGPDSEFVPLYIVVIAVAGVLLPLWSSLLVTFLASVLLVADVILAFPTQLGLPLWLQVAVFLGVALATGGIASRVRVVGHERDALKEEVHRLRLEAQDVLQSIGSGVLTVDAAGTLLYANPAAEGLLALPADHFLGGPVMGVLAERSPELARALAVTLAEGTGRQRLEGRVSAAGRAVTIGMTTTRLETAEGRPPSATVIFTDISDQKRVEELRLRAERLEGVAELAASLAHEIKNPLASIRSSVEQLARTAAPGEDEQVLGRLVLRESDRLSRLLTEFLEFARVRVIVPRPVDLRHVADSAAEVAQRHPAAAAGVRIRVSGTCAPVDGDEDLLHRLAVNLILNAVQAGGGDVHIDVEVAEARPQDLVGAAGLDRATVLRVRDDGPGIPEEVRGRLFQPFVSGRPGGTGLGLAIVQRTVEAHRGLIHVDSTPGRGTTFTILLPVLASGRGGSG